MTPLLIQHPAVGKPCLVYSEPYHYYGIVDAVEEKVDTLVVTMRVPSFRVHNVFPRRETRTAEGVDPLKHIISFVDTTEFTREYLQLWLTGVMESGRAVVLSKQLSIEPNIYHIDFPGDGWKGL